MVTTIPALQNKKHHAFLTSDGSILLQIGPRSCVNALGWQYNTVVSCTGSDGCPNTYSESAPQHTSMLTWPKHLVVCDTGSEGCPNACHKDPMHITPVHIKSLHCSGREVGKRYVVSYLLYHENEDVQHGIRLAAATLHLNKHLRFKRKCSNAQTPSYPKLNGNIQGKSDPSVGQTKDSQHQTRSIQHEWVRKSKHIIRSSSET